MMSEMFQWRLTNDLVWLLQAFGASAEAIEVYVSRGIINYGSTVSDFFNNGDLLVRQAKNQEGHGITTVLLLALSLSFSIINSYFTIVMFNRKTILRLLMIIVFHIIITIIVVQLLY